MKDLKFRAWTKDKKMVYNVVPFTWDYCINTMWHKCIKSNGDGILGSGGTEANFEVGGFSIIDGALMQFTGLKDKNGKEIYEGDILQSTCDTMLLNWLVEFGDGAFTNVNIGVGGYLGERFKLTQDKCGERLIIGNCFQNLDLLS